MGIQMGIIGTAFIRFVQLIGLVLIVTGITNLPALSSEFSAAWDKQIWSLASIAPRLALVTGPLLLGTVLVQGLQAYLQSAAAIAQRRKLYPKQPWLWRPEWADRHIRLSNHPLVIIVCYCWAFALLVFVPLAITFAAVKNDKGLTKFLSFFVGGMLLVMWAFTKQIRVNWRWSRSELKLAAVPGVIGGPLSGVILLHDVLPEGTAFRVSLICERTVSRRITRSKGTTSRTDVVWQTQRILNRTANVDDPGITGLPFQFAIDYDCKSTGDADLAKRTSLRTEYETEFIHWYVTIAIRDDPRMRGVRFEVPVYRTSESTPGFVLDESTTEPFLEKPDPLQVLQRGYLVEESDGERKRLKFGLFSWSLIFGLFGGILFFGLITAAIIYWVPPPPMYFAAMIPGILTLLIFYGLAEAVCWRSDIVIDREQIDIESGWWGFRRKTSFERINPPQFQTEVQFRKQDGAWWHIYVNTPTGTRQQVIQRLDGEQEAKAVRDWLNLQLTTTESNPTPFA